MKDLTLLGLINRTLFHNLMLLILLSSFGQIQAQNHAGKNYLGMSINVLKGETKPENTMLLQNVTKAEINRFTGGKLVSSRMESEDITEATSKYSTHMGMEGSYGAFSAKAEMDMSEEFKERSRTKTIIFSKDLSAASLSMKAQVVDLNLELHFEQALNDPNVSGITLFNNYGTHITLGVKVGGRVSAVYNSTSNSKEAQKSLSVSATASYGGVTAEVGHTLSSSSNSQSTKVNDKWIVHGGSSSLKLAVDSRKDAASYIAWARSVDDNPDFCAFTKIIPI